MTQLNGIKISNQLISPNRELIGSVVVTYAIIECYLDFCRISLTSTFINGINGTVIAISNAGAIWTDIKEGQKMYNVIGYYRVSSEEQALKDISIPAQRKLIRRYVDNDPEMSLIEDFVDQGHSAYAPADKRPGFCRMISFCKKNSVKHILVHKLDRFSRNREESIVFKSLLKKHGVTVKSITENYDPETPQGFLFEGMIETINQFYSMNLATETLKGMEENASRGFANGGTVPYAMKFIKIKDGSDREHTKLAPGNPKEIAIVRQIFDCSVNQRMGSGLICNMLNSEGTPSPRGGKWNKSTVDNILNNHKYIGNAVWNKSGKNGQSKKYLPRDKWIVVENAHEAIIGKELFQRRLQVIKERGFNRFKGPKKHVKWLLSRLIACGECGANYIGARQLRRKKAGGYTALYYLCGAYSSKGKAVCSSFMIDKQLLEGAVVNLIIQRICNPENIKTLETKTQEKLKARMKKYGNSSNVLEAKIASIERKIENYYLAIGEGFDRSKCLSLIDELKQQKEQLEKEAAILREENYYTKALENTMGKIRAMAESLQEDFDTRPFAERRGVIEFFVDKIEIVDHKKAVIHFKVPMDNGEIKLLTEKKKKVRLPIEPGHALKTSEKNYLFGTEWLGRKESNLQ